MTPPSHPEADLQLIREQAHRYMVACFGKDYVWRAPETFDNRLVRWIWALAMERLDFAEVQMSWIEAKAAEMEATQ